MSMRALLLVSVCGCVAAFSPAPLHAQPATAPSAPVEEGTYEILPVEVLPRLRNVRQVNRAVQTLHPPELRDSAISGEVTLRYRVLPTGRVDTATVVVLSTTDARFDEPARQVVRMMVFAPTEVSNRPVAVWVTQPLRFQAPQPRRARSQP